MIKVDRDELLSWLNKHKNVRLDVTISPDKRLRVALFNVDDTGAFEKPIDLLYYRLEKGEYTETK